MSHPPGPLPAHMGIILGGLSIRYARMSPHKVAACGVFYGKPVTEGVGGLPPTYAVFGGAC